MFRFLVAALCLTSAAAFSAPPTMVGQSVARAAMPARTLSVAMMADEVEDKVRALQAQKASHGALNRLSVAGAAA